MAKTLAPAKTPTVAIARVLRGLGLKQGHDFRVKGEYKSGERIGTVAVVSGTEANQTIADHADKIERLAAAEGFHFNVSIHFTPSGMVWVWVSNVGQRTRQTHFLSPIGRTTNTGSDLPPEHIAKSVHESAAAVAHLTHAPEGEQPRIRATLGAPRPAFEQPEDAPFEPYEGRAVRISGSRKWGCGEAGQMWFFQTTEHGPRYTLRVYLGRAQANGWYLSGPGIGSDAYMAGDLTTSMVAAGSVLDSFAWLIHRMEDVVHYYPKGQRVQGVDNYGVTCMGTVNGVAWGAVSDPNHVNYGRTWADVDWDEMPHNRGTGRRSHPFVSDLIKH